MNLCIGTNIRQLRQKAGISQEALAGVLGISVQAVSKWENEQSYPDIGFLPQIAAYFHVTTDYLLTGQESPEAAPAAGLPDDGVLRILQFRGSQLLTKNLYDPQIRIMLEIRKEDCEGNHCPTIPVEVWGSADIKGCISGGVRAGDGVNCGNVSGGVKAGDGVNCANVSGGVNAGDGVNCANVSGGVSAGDGVTCGQVSGGLRSGGSIRCGDIHGDILSCAGTIRCRRLKGKVLCDAQVVERL